jgi:pimeloyl-ACP methyl ester carboxylesterase
MYDAIRWLSLTRPNLTPVLAGLAVPTLLATAQDDPMWTVPAARAAAANLRHGAMTVLPGAGHIGPLLHRATAAQIAAFWRDPDGTITTHRAAISAGRP